MAFPAAPELRLIIVTMGDECLPRTFFVLPLIGKFANRDLYFWMTQQWAKGVQGREIGRLVLRMLGLCP